MLTEKQKRFCEEYLTDLNATQAAVRAGYSEKSAGRIAGENLKKLKIQAYIAKQREDDMHRTEITQDRVLQELACIGFADIADYACIIEREYESGAIDENGEPIKDVRTYQAVKLSPTSNIPQAKRGAIAAIRQGTNGIEIRLNNKLKALELLGKHFGMFDKKAENSNIEDIDSARNEVFGND